jgi:inner membrane protein
MDSITQITLGAAVGELVLGRKLGNRAMMWGAIAGTIPDLDIIANLFMEPIPALAVHRGISHSIFFSVFASFPFAWLIHKFYESNTYRRTGYKWFVFLLNLGLLIAITGSLSYMSVTLGTAVGIGVGIVVIALGILFMYRLYQNYFLGAGDIGNAKYKDWYVLFFFAFFTHIWLDCHTAFGTQIFQPFSDYRAAFNNISVADPAYTFPFLACVIIAAFHKRDSIWRTRWNYIGIAVSSIYMIWTLSNKYKVDRFFEKVIAEEQIEAIRYRTSPTILNNLLWGCVAETDSSYFIGLHSLRDKGNTIPRLNEIPKRHERLKDVDGHRDIQILKWFSDGYYTVWKNPAGGMMMSDLRYGAMEDEITSFEDFVFNFEIQRSDDGLEVKEVRNRPDNVGEAFSVLLQRIQGLKAEDTRRKFINH